MRQHRILIGLFSVLVLSTSTQAAPVNEQESTKNVQPNTINESSTNTKGGFYVGGGINFGWSDYDLSTDQKTSLTHILGNNESPMATEYYSNSETVTGSGVGGQLFAGYDFYIKPTLSIALEAQISAGDTADAEINHSTSVIDGSGQMLNTMQTKGKLEQDWMIGLSILPTYHYIDTGIDVFGIVGWQLSRFRISGIPGDISPLNRAALAAYESAPMASVNESKILNGVMLGFGMKKQFTEKLGVRLEYNWARFGSFNASGTNSANFPLSPQNGSVDYANSTKVSVRPTVQQVKLSLVYDIG